MRNYEILKTQLHGVIECIKDYAGDLGIRNTLEKLRESLESFDYELILYCCKEACTWYDKNIDNVLDCEYIYNDEEHKSNLILIHDIVNELHNEEKEYRQFCDSMTTTNPTSVNLTESTLKLLIDKFDEVVVQLHDRHANRNTLSIKDEYDVQDLLRSLLSIYCDDIRPEEWCPSCAGASSRQDFLLKKEKIVIETKKTRKGLNDKKLGEELIIDIARYKTHPDCNELVCFVYDPDRHIKNPRGIERDLSNDKENPKVKVYIRP